MTNKKITSAVVVAIAIVVVAGASFFGGMKYQQSKTVSGFAGPGANFMSPENFSPSNGANFATNNGGAQRARDSQMISGTILLIDGNSVTVEKPDSGSQTIYFSDTTSVAKSTEGSINELTIGQEIVVVGRSSSDGLITADSIQIRPEIISPTN